MSCHRYRGNSHDIVVAVVVVAAAAAVAAVVVVVDADSCARSTMRRLSTIIGVVGRLVDMGRNSHMPLKCIDIRLHCARLRVFESGRNPTRYRSHTEQFIVMFRIAPEGSRFSVVCARRTATIDGKRPAGGRLLAFGSVSVRNL